MNHNVNRIFHVEIRDGWKDNLIMFSTVCVTTPSSLSRINLRSEQENIFQKTNYIKLDFALLTFVFLFVFLKLKIYHKVVTFIKLQDEY